MSYQNLTIVGNVGRDAELKYTPAGIAVLKFSVAVNKTVKVDGEKRQTVTWFNVTLWRERAETLVMYVKAGMQVLVTGEVQVSPYIDRNGKPAASLELTADDVKLLTSKQEMDRRASGEYDDEPEPEPVPQPKQTQVASNGRTGNAKAKRSAPESEDIPF